MASLNPNFLVPRRSASLPIPKSQIGRDPQIETLYTLPSARILLFQTSSPISRPSSSSDGQLIEEEAGTLPWASSFERTIAVGPFRIYRAPGSVAFLNCQAALRPILPKSQCWAVDDESSKFVLQIRRPEYWRIEIPNKTPEDRLKAQELRDVLGKVLLFEKTPCPFRRGFVVELPETPKTPVKKKPWTPMEKPKFELLTQSPLISGDAHDVAVASTTGATSPPSTFLESINDPISIRAQDPATITPSKIEMVQPKIKRIEESLDSYMSPLLLVTKETKVPDGQLSTSGTEDKEPSDEQLSTFSIEDKEAPEDQFSITSTEDKEPLDEQLFIDLTSQGQSDSDTTSNTVELSLKEDSIFDDFPGLVDDDDYVNDTTDDTQSMAIEHEREDQIQPLQHCSRSITAPPVLSLVTTPPSKHRKESPLRHSIIVESDSDFSSSVESFHSVQSWHSPLAPPSPPSSDSVSPISTYPYPHNNIFLPKRLGHHTRDVSELTVTPGTPRAWDMTASSGTKSAPRSRSLSPPPKTPTLENDTKEKPNDGLFEIVAHPTIQSRIRHRATTSSNSRRRALSPLPAPVNLFSPPRRRSRRLQTARHLPTAIIQKTCEILLSPPSHLLQLMLNIASKIAAGEWRGFLSGQGESVHWDFEDEYVGEGWTEDDYGISLPHIQAKTKKSTNLPGGSWEVD